MILAIVLYGFAVLDLVQLAAVIVAHFIVGWVFMVCGVWVTPKLSKNVVPAANPFVTKAVENPSATKPPENPFAAKPVDEK